MLAAERRCRCALAEIRVEAVPLRSLHSSNTAQPAWAPYDELSVGQTALLTYEEQRQQWNVAEVRTRDDNVQFHGQAQPLAPLTIAQPVVEVRQRGPGAMERPLQARQVDSLQPHA